MDNKNKENPCCCSEQVDMERRRFLVRATTIMGMIGAFFAAIPFFSAWLPSAKAKALGGPIEVDLSMLNPGELITISWQGKPIWVLRRTEAMLKNLNHHNQLLRDPDSKVDQQPIYADNLYRSINPEFLVLVALCTHLGCIPAYKPNVGELGSDWPGGFYCPCHGSMFDLSGRVFKAVPAPINLEVPPYRFTDKHTIIIGEN